MIQFQNDLNYNLYRQKILGGNITGIWDKNIFFQGSNSFPIMNYNYVTSTFSDFEKNIFKNSLKVNYHLSGYGQTYNEALQSFLGESTERYSFTLLYAYLKPFIIKASYSSMVKKQVNDVILPLNLINVYFQQSEESNYLTENDIVSWVPLNSLNNLNKKIWYPLQLVILFSKDLFPNEKEITTSAVSTGTASGENIEQSIQSAIIENLQIDSFNLWWYGGLAGSPIDINIEDHLNNWFKNRRKVHQFLQYFNVTFTDISFDKPFPIIVCEISCIDQNDSLPKYVVGVQGGIDKEKCLYRGFFECLTVVEYTMTSVWTDSDKFKNIPSNILNMRIDNLDDNVLYYAKFGKQNFRKDYITKEFSTPKIDNLVDLLRFIQNNYKYSGFLNISPAEFTDKNFIVSRVMIPELLPIALPSFPPYYHSRYKITGGINNNVPHPLA